MYIKQDKLVRVFAVKMQLADPQDTEDALAAVQSNLTELAAEIEIESPLVTYDREQEANTNVILNFFLHLTNPAAPDRIRLSAVTDALADSAEFTLISVKID